MYHSEEAGVWTSPHRRLPRQDERAPGTLKCEQYAATSISQEVTFHRPANGKTIVPVHLPPRIAVRLHGSADDLTNGTSGDGGDDAGVRTSSLADIQTRGSSEIVPDPKLAGGGCQAAAIVHTALLRAIGNISLLSSRARTHRWHCRTGFRFRFRRRDRSRCWRRRGKHT